MRLSLPDDLLCEDNISLFQLEEFHVGERYLQWMNDPVIQQYLESRFSNQDMDSIRLFVKSCLDDPNSILFGIKPQGSKLHIGNIKIGPIIRHHLTGELGLLIGDSDYWGKGIATSAINCACRIMASELGLSKATAGAYESNKGSIRAFEKAGFTIEGVRPSQVLVDGKREAVVLLGRILR